MSAASDDDDSDVELERIRGDDVQVAMAEAPGDDGPVLQEGVTDWRDWDGGKAGGRPVRTHVVLTMYVVVE